MSKSKHCSGIPAGILDEDLEEYMSEKGPLEAAILALAYRNTYVAVGEMTAAIRVLENWPKWEPLVEAAGKTPDRWAVEVALTNPTIGAWQKNILRALLEALPDREKK